MQRSAATCATAARPASHGNQHFRACILGRSCQPPICCLQYVLPDLCAGNLSELDEEDPVFEDRDLSGMSGDPSTTSPDKRSGKGHWKGGSTAALPNMLAGADDSGAAGADAAGPEGGSSLAWICGTLWQCR